MIVKEMSVEIHEKRNHPHEFGHYDASVRLTAVVESSSLSVSPLIDALIAQAREKVVGECDRWITAIEEERRLEILRSRISQGTGNLQYARNLDVLQSRMEEIEVMIRELSCAEQNAALTEMYSEADKARDRITRMLSDIEARKAKLEDGDAGDGLYDPAAELEESDNEDVPF